MVLSQGPRIAIVGAGIFGITTAIKLAEAGYEVTVFEKEKNILMAASGINQYRLHRGYHYPRGIETAINCRNNIQRFYEEYSEAVISDTEQYYCISKRDSLVSSKNFLKFCDDFGLQYKITDLDLLHPDSIDVCVKVEECLFDLDILRNILNERISQESIKIEFGINPYEDVLNSYDYNVISTYTNNNKFIKSENAQEYKYELCEKPVVKLLDKYKHIGLVVMDGPFMCIDPLGQTGYHVMGNVVHAIHETAFAESLPELGNPEFSELLNRGIIENPPITNFTQFIESASEFLIDIEKCVHVGSMFTHRVVLPNTEDTDDRPTIVEKIDHKTITLFSGKIITCVSAAEEVVEIINQDRI